MQGWRRMVVVPLLFFGNSCKRQSAQMHFGKWRRWPWPWPSFSLGTLARGNLLRCTLGNGEGGLGLGPPFLWVLLQEAICSDALWEMEKVALALALLFFGYSCKRQSAQMHFGKWRRWPWPWPSFSLGTLARGNLLRCTLGNGEGGLALQVVCSNYSRDSYREGGGG